MSDTTASLRRKIEGARDLRAVVSTMKALAAASIGQYEKSVHALDGYYRAVQLGLSVCFRTSGSAAAVAGQKKDVGITGAVVFGSDQGLVGQFNDVVADYAVQTLAALPGKKKIWAVGERVHDRLALTGMPLAGLLTVPLSIRAITPLVGQILFQMLVPEQVDGDVQWKREGTNEMSQLYLFYNSSRAGAVYAPVHQRLLPLDAAWRRDLASLPWPTKNLPEVIGGSPATLQALVREYLFVSLFRACAESLASENASRLAAMERAEKNIDQLSTDLHHMFYRLRQSKIDEELFDVISGVEALAGAEQARRPVDSGDGWD
ncbi:F0F1 ATP synthase subunit gamma [Nitrosospira sp. Nsp13]|uniref:F0F1 ATP synthase subunit gamma n=1 Tax=Nitrosospira sp. Nsp13 TaxID=1855332 RepID=UPI00088DCF00|nr:F0F1 ATP synthase subunit gamma [Nitrosospira sp. Nsp13]SCX85712.1 F-type H+-transporting ATPase subunit gamma [Nitrosospira sp. Nsp13]